MLKGIGASNGTGVGYVLKIVETPLEIRERTVTDPVAEKQRFGNAVGIFCDRTQYLADMMDGTAADGQILRSYIAMINDPELCADISSYIDGGMCAEKAFHTACDKVLELFCSSPDELLRQRAADIADVRRQVLKILLGIESVDLKSLPENTILVVEELTPTMTAVMDTANIRGIVTEKGGWTSHSAIISRSLKIPAVLSVKDALKLLDDGREVIIDGEKGEVYIDYTDEFRQKYICKCEQDDVMDNFGSFIGLPTETADKQPVRLLANIGSHREMDAVRKCDAEGVGLFRTEYLFLDRVPCEEEQFAAYKAVAEGLNGREAVLRTLDIGGDKELPALDMAEEDNPFLGLRAVRFCLKNPAVFRTQLRAILRASAYGDLSVLIPMVTRVSEVITVREMIEELKTELDAKNIPYKRDIKVGVMIETPAACAMADVLAKYADFFSIGTNDLIGYTMAADRGNGDVGYLYSCFDPAVLRCLRHVIGCASTAGIECTVCGEAAADERLLPVLLSFGLRTLSVEPLSVLPLRARLSELTKPQCDRLADTVMAMDKAEEIEAVLKSNI